MLQNTVKYVLSFYFYVFFYCVEMKMLPDMNCFLIKHILYYLDYLVLAVILPVLLNLFHIVYFSSLKPKSWYRYSCYLYVLRLPVYLLLVLSL